MPHVAFGGLLGPDGAATPAIFEVIVSRIKKDRWLGLAATRREG